MAIPAYYSLIQRGSSGPDVALVQTWLNGIRDSCTWHATLPVDGKFGANAEKAVREFQLRYGLKEDGKVGANTWNVLLPTPPLPETTPMTFFTLLLGLGASCCGAAAWAAASGWCNRSSTPRASGSPPTAGSVPAPSPPSSATKPATA